MTAEIVLMWIALTFYVAGTAMFVSGVVFEHEKWTRTAVLVSAIGLVPQIASMTVRWIRLGHGPYLGYYELTSSLTFFTVLLLVGMAWRYPKTSSAGIVIMPVALLLIGAAMTAPKGGLNVTPTLASYWLFIHVVFSDLAFGAFVPPSGWPSPTSCERAHPRARGPASCRSCPIRRRSTVSRGASWSPGSSSGAS